MGEIGVETNEQKSHCQGGEKSWVQEATSTPYLGPCKSTLLLLIPFAHKRKNGPSIPTVWLLYRK